MKRAVCLLSGGMDSAVSAAAAKNRGFEIYALTVDYGQRHRNELAAAKRIASSLGAGKHMVIEAGMRGIGGSALTANLKVPRDRNRTEIGRDIPVTYVPARNMILLGFAVAWAEVLNAPAVFIGVNAVDCSGYPDCRPGFIRAIEKAAAEGTKAGAEGRRIKIIAPLAKMSKAEIVRLGTRLMVDFKLTRSCYSPDSRGRPCGRCDACLLRAKGFEEAGVEDPLIRRAKCL